MNAQAATVLGVVTAFVPLVLVLVLWVASLYSESAANFVYKLHLLRLGASHLLLSTDKKWKKPVGDSGRIRERRKQKRVVLIRHGESQWNVVFNKGLNASFPKRLGNALHQELMLLGTLDSVFVDSPMSADGADQARELAEYVESPPDDDEVGAVLKGTSKTSSVIASSNLRRALSTGTVAFWGRLKRTQEKVHVLSALQEVTFNIDGVALSKPRSAPVLSDVELDALHQKRADFHADRYFDCTANAGDKSVRSRGVDRMLQFCKWCLDRPEDVVIAAGHSLYFRFLFQTLLPLSSTHRAKKDKMGNCSVVSFLLFEGIDSGTGQVFYGIDESTIAVHHNDFEGPGHGKKKKN